MINISNIYKKYIGKKGKASDNNEPNAENASNNSSKTSKIGVIDIIGGRILVKKSVLSQIPLLIMIVIYSISMVANRYYIEQTSIEIKDLQKEIDELQIRKIQVECDYVNMIKISEMSKRLESKGIQQSTDRPSKVIINKD
ncbi:MAG: hypothetical protein IKY79_06660 [Bacteroidales bacterium]|jgi:hypothetical protein|nr:hypothetical protein [Bacteroidales bacterium]